MIVVSKPFPHVVVDGLFPIDLLKECRKEIPSDNDSRWDRFINKNEHKLGGPKRLWGPATCEYFKYIGSVDFCKKIQEVFSIGKTLTMDTTGGGYHAIPEGGYLDIHVDFNRGEDGLYRRINMLTYLNEEWQEGMGGELELWENATTPSLSISPMMGKTVLFATSEHSWHGHPNPTKGYRRCSLAAYYYSEEPSEGVAAPHSTIFI